MPKITTDISDSTVFADRRARKLAIHDFWFGTGAYVAAGTCGVVRAQMNTIAPNDTANQETLASWRVKWNAMNEPDKLLHDTLKDSNPSVVALAHDSVRVFDATGSVAVTAPGTAISLIGDDYAGITLGSELVTNGDFSSATGWTAPTGWTISGGVATKTAGTANSLTTAVTLVSGRAYMVESKYNTVSASTVTPRFTGGATVTGLARSAAGTYRQIMIATAAHTTLDLLATATTAAVLDYVSVKEITNWPLFQNTDANRIRWGRAPVAVRNLQPNSDFSGAAVSPQTAPTDWTLGPVTNRGTLTDILPNYDGTGSNGLRMSTAAQGFFLTGRTFFLRAGQTLTASMFIEILSGTTAVRDVIGLTHDPSNAPLTLTYRLNGVSVAGATTLPLGTHLVEAISVMPPWYLADGQLTNAAGAWYDSGPASGAETTFRFGITARSSAATATCAAIMWAPQVELSGARSTYQRCGQTQTDITETNVTAYGLFTADTSNDLVDMHMPLGGTVSIGLYGRGGSYVIPSVTVAAPSQLRIGLPSILDNGTEILTAPARIVQAVGSVDWSDQLQLVGIAVLKANPSTEEQLRAARYFAAYGAAGPLTAGADIVANGTFATDTVWTKGTGWTIGSGVATKTAGTAALLSQGVTVTPSVPYLLQYTLTRSAGTITPRFFGGTTFSGTTRSAAGTYLQVLMARVGTLYLQFDADSAFAGTVDNVTLRPMTPAF